GGGGGGRGGRRRGGGGGGGVQAGLGRQLGAGRGTPLGREPGQRPIPLLDQGQEPRGLRFGAAAGRAPPAADPFPLRCPYHDASPGRGQRGLEQQPAPPPGGGARQGPRAAPP